MNNARKAHFVFDGNAVQRVKCTILTSKSVFNSKIAPSIELHTKKDTFLVQTKRD